jgi:hypothetical protein
MRGKEMAKKQESRSNDEICAVYGCPAANGALADRVSCFVVVFSAFNVLEGLLAF